MWRELAFDMKHHYIPDGYTGPFCGTRILRYLVLNQVGEPTEENKDKYCKRCVSAVNRYVKATEVEVAQAASVE